VIVCPAPGEKLSAACFHAGWEYNVLLPRKHSRGEDGYLIDDFREELDDQVFWALLCALGVGCGLFSFMERGTFDHERCEGEGGNIYVRVADFYVRIIDGGDLVGELLARVFSGEEDYWPVPEQLLEANDPTETVARVAERSVAALGVEYRPRSRVATPRRTLTISEVLSQFLSHLFTLGRHAPYEIVLGMAGQTIVSLEKTIKSRTIGEDAPEVIQSGNPLRRFSTLNLAVAINYLDDLPWTELPLPKAEPAIWRCLRSVTLGLIDGGDFEPEMADHHPVQGRRRVVVSARSLVIDRPVEEYGWASDDPPGGDSTDENNSADLDVGADLDSDSDDHAGSDVGQSGPSYWTQVETRMDDAVSTAWSAVARHQQSWVESLSAIDDAKKQLNKSQRWVRRWSVAAWTAAIASVGTQIWLLSVGSTVARHVVLGGLGVSLFIGCVLCAASALRRINDAVNDLRNAIEDADYSMAEHQNALVQFTRLGYIRQQADDWRQILACVVHYPLGATLSPTAQDSLPMSTVRNLSFSRPDIDIDHWRAVVLETRRLLTGQGWLGQMFGRSLEVWMECDALLRNPRDPRDQNPDFDSSVVPAAVSVDGVYLHNPRHQMAKDLTGSEIGSVVYSRYRAEVESECTEVLVDLAFREVVGPQLRLADSENDQVDVTWYDDRAPWSTYLGGILEATGDGAIRLMADSPDERVLLTSQITTASGVSPAPDRSRPLINGHDHENVRPVEQRVVLASYRSHLSPECRQDALSLLEPPDEGPGWVRPDVDGPVL
jgi:hypothetical protein